MAVNTTFQNITLRVGNIQGDRNVYVYAKQYDAASRYLLVDLRDDNGRVEVGGTPQLNAIKPDGTFSYTAGSIEETGLMLFELSSQVLAVPGKVECDISVFGSETELIDLFRGDGINSEFHLHYVFSEITSVKIAGTETSDYTFDSTNQTITFTTVPAVTSSIVVEGTGKSLLTSSTFFVIVSRSAYNPEAIESSDEFTTLSEAIEAANACIAKEVVREANEAQRILNEEGRVAAEAAREAKWGSATATATSIPAIQDASVSVTQDSSGTHFAFGIPTGNGIASITKTGTSGNVDTYTITFTNGTTQTYEVTNGASTVKVGGVIQSEINFDSDPQEQLDQKANADGYYETLGSGTSDQLLSTVSINDKVPYNFRTAGGSADIGDRLTDKIVGGTIIWNQHWYNSADFYPAVDEDFVDGIKVSAVDLTTGTITLEVSSDTRENAVYRQCWNGSTSPTPPYFKNNATHRWLLMGIPEMSGTKDIILGISTTNARFYDGGAGTVFNYDAGGFYMRIYVYPSCPAGIYKIRPQLIDLTRMFGSEIAEYLYSIDVSTRGSAKTWFRKLFPKEYYPYNNGTGIPLSVNVSSHDTVEFNAFDKNAADVVLGKYLDDNGEEQTLSGNNITGYITVVGGQTYYFKNATTTSVARDLVWYDANKNIIKIERIPYSTNPANIKEAPINARFVRVSVITSLWDEYNVNLHWDGERDGEYAPYVKHTYALDHTLTLLGMPKLDSDNKLYYDGDTYKSDGTIIRKYALVDLGTLTWRISTVTISGVSTRVFRSIQPQSASKTLNALISTRYNIHGGSSATVTNMPDKSIIVGTTYYGQDAQFAIRDSSYAEYTEEQFKAAMSGIYLVYALRSSSYTIESAEPFTNPQIVDDFGTEEYIDYAYSQGTRDVAIPVGHDTNYYPNLRAKLEMAPDSPDGDDGLYVVSHISATGKNTYIPLPKELPTIPTENGDYQLKVSIVNGQPTYSWEPPLTAEEIAEIIAGLMGGNQ